MNVNNCNITSPVLNPQILKNKHTNSQEFLNHSQVFVCFYYFVVMV